MADVSSLLSTLLNGGGDSNPNNGSGFQALAGSEPTTGATVLARLKGAGNGNGPLGLGKAAGGSDVKLDTEGSKIGAVASGIASGMKDAADARAAQQKQSIELMKMQWDHNFKLAELKQKIDSGNATQAELKRYHDILDKYYTGQNEKTSKSDDPNSVDNLSKIQRARADAAKTFGLHDTVLDHHVRGTGMNANDFVTPEEKASAQAELDRRTKLFNDWDTDPARPWNAGKKGKVTPPPPPTADGDPPADPDADPDTSNVPTPPARPTDLAPPTAPDLAPPAAAPAGPRSVTGPDGRKYTYTDQGGLVPATPDSAVPSDDTAPAWIPGT